MKTTLIFLLSLTFLVLLVLALMTPSWISCSRTASLMGRDYKFGPFVGCVVKSGNHYTPIKNVRDMDDMKDAGAE